MGMESVYKLSVLLNLVDNLSGPISKAQKQATGTVDKLNSAFGTMQKAGAAMAGIGGAFTGIAMSTATATFDTQNALGELASLGVKDLKAVEDAAKSFSDTWAGTSKSDFITASYDIKSGIASLTDEGVAQFTQLAALTGKATKSTTEEMGSLFATGYGIYKGFYDDMSDLEFGEMFSAGIATAVKNYKTSGSEMAGSISALGATATNANVPLEEQLAILGQLQTTMSGSEAATKYKSFLNQASKAGEKLGLTFLDSNSQLLSMPEILTELKSKYGDTIDAVEKRELKEAFGTDEAVALIDLLYNNVEMLDTGIQDLQSSMRNGISVTEEMAEAINNTPEQKFQVLKQQIHNNMEELGSGLLPIVNETMEKVSGLISRGSEWISSNRETVQTIMSIILRLGVFLTVAGSVMGVVGTVGKTFLAAKNAIGLARTAVMGLNSAFLASPVTWVTVAIVALVAAFAVLWNRSEAFRSFWTGVFDQVKSTFRNGLNTVKGFCSSILGAAASTVREKLGNMKAAYEEHGGGIKGVAAAALEGVKGYFTAGYTFIDNLTGGRLTDIKNKFSEKMSGAAETVSGAIERIKSFFNFSWSLPSLKLPHFSIEGSFSLNPPSIPHLGVEWYKDGGILTGPTIFGSMGGSLLGGGEAGAEAVLPLAELWKRMREIVGSVVRAEGDAAGDDVQSTGANITNALTSKSVSVLKEKETAAARETVRTERWDRERGITINNLQISPDISKIKDLPLLYKLIDELKDAYNRTEPAPSTP